jgi:hypothetical protein
MTNLHPGRKALLELYRQLLRSAETYPSRNRQGIYQAIREEWRTNKTLQAGDKLNNKLTIAFQGLTQLRQFDETTMTGGDVLSPNWSVTLEQNPIPKPDDYDERKRKR